ncbi:MAG: ParA family protein [Lachnospiraceae bacterium]|nr:ParA family protein [Lachnospiraceae bacterium]
MANIISIVNQKGGVGKTTTATHLGIGLAQKGRRVLLVDADPQGNLTTCLGWYETDSLEHTLGSLMREAKVTRSPNRAVGFRQGEHAEADNGLAALVRKSILHHDEGVDLIPTNLGLAGMDMELAAVISRERILARILACVKDDYDYILIDCGPSLGLVTVNALTASNGVIIPVQAQYLSVVGMVQLIGSVQEVQMGTNPHLKVYGILITMLEKTKMGKQSTENIEEFGKNYGIRIYRSRIPRRTRVADASVEGKSLYRFDNGSLAADAYRTFTDEVLESNAGRICPQDSGQQKNGSGGESARPGEVKRHGV